MNSSDHFQSNSSRRKSVLVGIPNYNGAHLTSNLLLSIAQANDNPKDYKVNYLLIDDGSNAMECTYVQELSQEWNVPVIFHEQNFGISKSWNDIGNYGNFDIIVWLNNDIMVSPDWLTAMIYFLEHNPKAGAVGWSFMFIIDRDIPLILSSRTPYYIQRDAVTKAFISQKKPDFTAPPGRMMCAVGCCFAMTREKYDILVEYNVNGGFDESMKSFHEESDAFTHLSALGFFSYMIPYPHLYHHWGKTFGENPELEHEQRMVHSRKIYCDKWNVPENYSMNPFEYTDAMIMKCAKPIELKWLDENLKEKCDVV